MPRSSAKRSSTWPAPISRSGKTDDARAAYRRSIARLEKQVRDYPGIADYRFSLALAHDNFAHFQKTIAGLKSAEPERQEARTLYDGLRHDFPENVEYRLRYALDLDEHAILLAESDRLQEAVADEKSAVELLAQIVAADPTNPAVVRETARRRLNLGQLYARDRRIEDAEAEYALAIALLQGAADRRLPGDESWYDLPAVYMNQAKLFEDQGRGKAVERSVRQAVAVSRSIAAANPSRADALAGLAGAEFNLGSLPTVTPDEAITRTRDAVEQQRAALAVAPKRADLVVGMGIYGGRLITILADRGDHAAAASAAAALAGDIPEWRGWPLVAGQLARCVRLARTDKKLSDGEKAKLSGVYGGQALDLLRKAVAAGYKDAAALQGFAGTGSAADRPGLPARVRKDRRRHRRTEPEMTPPIAREIATDVSTQIARLNRRDVPSVRMIRRSFSRSLRTAAPMLLLRAADALVGQGDWPHRLIAFELIAGHSAALAALDRPRLLLWSRGLASWEDVDMFACTLGGQAWRAGVLTDADIESWSRSPDRWQRRLALVCTVPLNAKARGGTGDPARTLRVCEALVEDRDDMVVKAFSSALRELSKRDEPAVREFLARHGERLAGRVRREVTSKLTTGLKTPRRRPPQPGRSSSRRRPAGTARPGGP